MRLIQDAHYLELVVRDRGSAIDPKHLPRIFEPGFTTKEFARGSGLGLAKVRSVAEGIFHGTVRVDSSPGVGATFTVILRLPPQRGS